MITTTHLGSFFHLNGQHVLRGYGGLKSGVSNFKDAIDAGIVLFDLARAYKNEPAMRDALKGKDVKQFILSSKIPGSELNINDLKGSTESCFQGIINDLGVDKIDILYLHGPDCIHEDVLNMLVQLKEDGKIQHIGLSNVNKNTLEAMLQAGYPISVVQNEFNPYFWDEEVLNFCHEKNIVVAGYRPFGDKMSAEIFQNDVLKNIAFREDSTVQTVLLQWMNQHGVTPIPHSNNKARIENNAMIPQWTLTQEEMKQMDGIKQNKSSTCGWEKFLNKELLARSTEWINNFNHSKL